MPIPEEGLAEAAKRAYAGGALKPSRCVLQQLRWEGKQGLAAGILNATMMATVLLSLQALELGKPFSAFLAAKSARRNVVHFARTWNVAETLEVPVTLYLRSAVDVWKGGVQPHTLYGDGSIKVFHRWLERHFQRYYRESEAVDKLAAMSQYPDILSAVLRDIETGKQHVAKVQGLGTIADLETLLWLEQLALPGAYLLTQAPMREAYISQDLSPIATRRMEKAFSLMECPGVVEGLISRGVTLQ